MQSKGFTLIELLISAGILAFAICGLIFQINNGILLNKMNREFTVALSHAQYVLEAIKNTQPSLIATSIDANAWDWNTDAQFNANGIPSQWRLTNEAINTNYVPLSNPLEVAVTVTWIDPRQRQIELRTLFN